MTTVTRRSFGFVPISLKSVGACCYIMNTRARVPMACRTAAVAATLFCHGTGWAADFNPPLSLAGMWVPVTDTHYLSSQYNGTLANTFHAIIPLGSAGQYGMVVTGWGYSGWPPTLTTIAPVSIAILAADARGNFGINTSTYIGDPVTHGGGSLIIADFNGDGRPDIFLAAHNESPFISMPSTVYLSNATDGFTKVTLPDHVMAHDAELAYINGRPAVLTGTFSPGDANPIYTFANGAFVESIAANVSQLGGMDTTLVNSGGSAGMQLIRGDVNTGYDPATGYSTTQNINVYAFNGTDVTSTAPTQSIIPYLSTLPQYASFPAQIGGPGLTHTYRVWSDDLNHDGMQDILAGESMWSQTNPNFPSILQVLINRGDGTFRDATATLNPDMKLNTSEMDYTPAFIDLDHSGINTYLFAGSMSWGDPTRQSDYVLLNDGTGRLYVGVHDQFALLAPKVFAFLGMVFNSTTTPPRFIAIPQPDGSLNFVAEVPTSTWNATANISQTAYQYVNVPVRFNPTTDFTQGITVTDRNQSMLMRTWAGNDTFHDTNASASASPTSIDGGSGFNTCVYSGRVGEYTIRQNAAGTVTVKGRGLTDNLKNIQRLVFSDEEIALTAPAQVSQGWSLLGNSTSLPLNVASSFSDETKVASVWKWSPATGKWGFFTPALSGQALIDYAAANSYEILATIGSGEGYWVNAKTAFTIFLPAAGAIPSTNFQPSGAVSAGGANALHSGWSLIATGDSPSPAQFSAVIAAAQSTPPAATLTSLWAWDAAQQKWYLWAPSLANDGSLADYLGSRGYLDFSTMPTAPNGTLSPTTGFWANMR